MKNNGIIISILLFIYTSVLFSQNYEYLKMKNFANALFKEGEYYRAITEYKRILSYFPEKKDTLFIKIPECYFRGQHYTQAIKYYKEFYRNTDIADKKAYCLFQIGRGYLYKNDYGNSQYYFNKLFEGDSAQYADNARYYMAFIEAKKFKWQNANEWLLRISKNRREGFNVRQLTTQIAENNRIPTKSPFWAGTLSAIVPGAGYCYVGSCKIGIASLFLNALFFYGAYESFHQKSYVVGTTFVVIGLGWYTGNIFGSVTKAHRYNREKKQQFLDHLNFRF